MTSVSLNFPTTLRHSFLLLLGKVDAEQSARIQQQQKINTNEQQEQHA